MPLDYKQGVGVAGFEESALLAGWGNIDLILPVSRLTMHATQQPGFSYYAFTGSLLYLESFLALSNIGHVFHRWPTVLLVTGNPR